MGRKRKQDGDKYARIGLTLPPELKKRMMSLSVVNWSEVAVAAFLAKVEWEEAMRTASKEPQGSPLPNDGAVP